MEPALDNQMDRRPTASTGSATVPSGWRRLHAASRKDWSDTLGAMSDRDLVTITDGIADVR